MKERLAELKKKAAGDIDEAADEKEISDIRVRYLGKKGHITSILKELGKLSPEERKEKTNSREDPKLL